MRGQEIISIVESVTKAWAKQRKREERDTQARLHREAALQRRGSLSFKEAAYAVMHAAYMKASSNNTLPAQARQIMYAARGRILELTGKNTLKDSYFTQTLLTDYLREFPEETANWDVVFDARGNFHEPHTDRVVPLGTIPVRDYLRGGVCSGQGIHITGGGLFPTHGPVNRFKALLFIEKEGFWPLLSKIRLAERYDLAIMSTKGLSVTASRSLVDQLCGEHDMPLLVLHDFDKAGFSIVGTLGRDTRRYSFTNDIKVIDLGIRLADVEACQLETESVHVKSDPTDNLLENGATWEEVRFLRSGRRVELNAFTSGNFVSWIESKLEEHGIAKVVPDDAVLEQAYRRALAHDRVKLESDDLIRRAEAWAATVPIPGDLRSHVTARIEQEPSIPWDAAVAAEASSLR